MAIKKTTTKSKTTSKPEADPAIHADHPGGSVTTTDHAAIKAWAEARGGRPAAVEGTGGGDDVGIIRLEFPSADQRRRRQARRGRLGRRSSRSSTPAAWP